MCGICQELITERAIIDRELRAMQCGQKVLKAPHRRHYYREYYQANRDKKLKAANERYRSKKLTGVE